MGIAAEQYSGQPHYCREQTMRGLAIAGVVLATCTLAAAQDSPGRTDSQPPASGNWFTRLWSFGDKPAPKKAPAAEKKIEQPTREESASKQRAHEEAVLHRRNEVILKLREIAQRTGDNALLVEVDELQDRAWELYLQKTASGGSQR
jgi:hypothetical protein